MFGKFSFGKWSRFDGDPSAAAALAYLNVDFTSWQKDEVLWERIDKLSECADRKSVRKKKRVISFQNESNENSKMTDSGENTNKDITNMNLDVECRLASIGSDVYPLLLVWYQALLPTPPVSWKKHSLPSIARNIRRLVLEANSRQRESIQLARIAAWNQETDHRRREIEFSEGVRESVERQHDQEMISTF